MAEQALWLVRIASSSGEMFRSPAISSPIRGNSNGLFSFLFFHAGGRSGESVSITMVSIGNSTASLRSWCARSYVTVTAETDLESQINESFGLLETAAESMRDSQMDFLFAKMFQNGIDRAPGMQ